MKYNEEKLENITPTAVLVIRVESKVFYANLADSKANALVIYLSSNRLNVKMNDNGLAKVYQMENEFALDYQLISVKPGDLVLTDDFKLALFYDYADITAVKIASIGNSKENELKKVIGIGNIDISFELEWSE